MTVICWILPQTEATKSDQRREEEYPSERWIRARIFGDAFNKKVGEFVVGILGEQGYEAVCPMNSPFYEDRRSEKFGYVSRWSERHAAFISGLGTFGLSDALITPLGKAMRCGSVVSNIKIKPTKRPYKKYNEYCLYYTNGSCMKCAERCPAKAINANGHDKLKCRAYQRQITEPHTMQQYNLKSASYGLCQFGIPCESGIPIKK